MYVCLYVRMHVCMYVCVCMYVFMYVCMYVFMYVCMCVYVCIYVCMCMYVYMYVCIHVHVLGLCVHAVKFISNQIINIPVRTLMAIFVTESRARLESFLPQNELDARSCFAME
jgi:hypothetical protein